MLEQKAPSIGHWFPVQKLQTFWPRCLGWFIGYWIEPLHIVVCLRTSLFGGPILLPHHKLNLCPTKSNVLWRPVAEGEASLLIKAILWYISGGSFNFNNVPDGQEWLSMGVSVVTDYLSSLRSTKRMDCPSRKIKGWGYFESLLSRIKSLPRMACKDTERWGNSWRKHFWDWELVTWDASLPVISLQRLPGLSF